MTTQTNAIKSLTRGDSVTLILSDGRSVIARAVREFFYESGVLLDNGRSVTVNPYSPDVIHYVEGPKKTRAVDAWR